MNEAVEYEVATLNGTPAFVIDDHHLPFSAADKLQTRVANMHMTCGEYYHPDSAHAIYEFNLQNTTTQEKAAFSLVICPVTTVHDDILKTAFMQILREAHNGQKTKAAIISRSLCSLALEKQVQIAPSDQQGILFNLGSWYFYFESSFEALNQLFQDVMYPPRGVSDVDVNIHIAREWCPYCAKLSASPTGAFV